MVSSKSLSDSSTDLWKTIRVWSDQFRSGTLDPFSTSLTLLTTSEAPIGSAASYLRLKNRDQEKALEILDSITTTSKSATNAKYHQAFARLSATQRNQLVRSIYILDRSPDMAEALNLLRQELRLTTIPTKVNSFAARIEGWWFQTVVQQLCGEKPFITGSALEAELADLREQFRLDNLPIDLADIDLPDAVPYDDFPFVRQIQHIMSARVARGQASDFCRTSRASVADGTTDDQIIPESRL